MKGPTVLLFTLVQITILSGCLKKTPKKVEVKKSAENSRSVKMPIEEVVRKAREEQENNMPKD